MKIALFLFLAMATVARAQFAPIFTNATLAGSGTKVPSGGTLTIQSGGTLDFSAGTLVGTINLGTNASGILAGVNGGTGVANAGKTITLGGNITTAGILTLAGNFTTVGAYPSVFTMTGNTAVTLPTTGTLATLAGAESLTNKKLGSLTSNGVIHTSSGDGTLSVATVAVNEGGTGITAGNSGGIPYFSGSTTIGSSAALTANYVVLGGGAGGAPSVVGSPGTTATVLHGNASGAPTFGAVSLTADVSGTLPVANGGTNVTSYTKGDILIASAGTTLAKLAVGTDNKVLTANSSASTGVSWETGGGGGGSGNVTGPASSVDGNIVTWNGTAGTSIKDAAGITAVSGTITSTAANITVATGVSNGNVNVTANGTGNVVLTGNVLMATTNATLQTTGNATIKSGGSRTFLRSTSVSGTNLYVVLDSIGAAQALYEFTNGDAAKWYHGMESDLSYMIFDAGTGSAAFKIVTGGGVQLRGTNTTDSASAAFVGEYVSSLIASGSAVSLTTATAANVTSISLTAGDWDVSGIVNFAETSATVTARTAGISTTTATLPTDGSEGYCGVQSTVTSETNSITLQRKRISVSSTTTVYLVGKATFSAGAAAQFGAMTARRVR